MGSRTTEPQIDTSRCCAIGSSDILPEATLDQLADRFRAAGLFFVTLRNDGGIGFHDLRAHALFRQFVLPLFRRHPSIVSGLTGIDAQILDWDQIPGVVVAAFPVFERKRVRGFVLLAGKAPDLNAGARVVELCGSLQVDAEQLVHEARTLPAYTQDGVVVQAEILRDMIADRVRTSGLETEINALSVQLSNTYEELSLIYQLSGGMRVNRRPRDFFREACCEAIDVIGVRGLGVVVDIDDCPLEQPLLYGTLNLPADVVKRLGRELIANLRQRKAPLLINRLLGDPNFGWLADHAQNLVAMPLARQDQIFGCIFALEKLGSEFDTVDIKLLDSIANESSIYLENAMLYGDIRGLLMGLLHGLVNAVDAKDAYTCGHSERVALLSRVLAQEARLGDQVVDRIYMSGLLHDVGKIGVPEAVLQKSGRLTPEEFEQVKKHPQIGARILQDIKQLHDIIPGVLYHHERYDGKGYPTGLAGEQIPLMGRVICLADCFDAMTSTRTYRKALPLEVALTEIRRCAGTQFDPALTDMFLSIGGDRIRQILMDHKRQTKHLIEKQQSLRAA